jgi:hypothetical protein
MEHAQKMIEIYHGIRIFCMGAGTAALIAALAMFIGFRIPRTVRILQGRGKVFLLLLCLPLWPCLEGRCEEMAGTEQEEQAIQEEQVQEKQIWEVQIPADQEGVFCLQAADFSGTLLSCRASDWINGKSLQEIQETAQEEGCPYGIRKVEDGYLLTFALEMEANYVLMAEEQVLATFSLDRTAPVIERGDIVCSAREQTFLEKLLEGISFGYFCQPELTVRVQAEDSTSGVASITCICEGVYGEEGESLLLTSTVEAGDGLSFIPGTNAAFMTVAIPESFQGTIRAMACDNTGNVMAEWTKTTGVLVESEATHEKNASATLYVIEGTGKKPGFYNSDVVLQAELKDSFSGIRRVVFQAGNQQETSEYSQAGEEIIKELTLAYTLKAQEQNRNQIPLSLVFTDLAGYTSEPQELPVIHIDTEAPKLQLEWDNTSVKNEKYYNADRCALISVKERNFDPEDVQMELTGMELPELVWSHQAGEGCTASEDPQDLNHADSCLWVTQLLFDTDGEYSLTLSCRDAAGNEGSLGRVDSFIIDKTPPLIQVSWNDGRAEHGKYYSQIRRAKAEILEKNFWPEYTQVAIQAYDRGKAIKEPGYGAFLQDGEAWRTELAFEYDGTFQLQISCVDLAGNEAQMYRSEEFVIDLTPPELTFFGVADCSANNGTVVPGFVIEDTNYDPEQVSVSIQGSSGKGEILERTELEQEYGRTVQWEDFLHIPKNDDLYHILVKVSDLAGNSVTGELRFSVNRYGSVYVLDEETDRLAGADGVRYTAVEPDLIIKEYNVDLLEKKEVTYSREGEVVTLHEGSDYHVTVSGNEDTWKCYLYRIPGRNFSREGSYLVTLYSEDRATNVSSNRIKEASLEFIVDKTAPGIVLSGVEAEGSYEGSRRNIRVDIQDNLSLQGAELYVNGEQAASYTGEELREKGGSFDSTLYEKGEWQTIRVCAWDTAGNRADTGEVRFYLSSQKEEKLPDETNNSDGEGRLVLYAAFAAAVFIAIMILQSVVNVIKINNQDRHNKEEMKNEYD